MGDRLLRVASLFQQSATPTLTPQTAQNCGSYSFDARMKILIEMYCSHQYLPIDPKQSLPRPQTAQTCDAHNFNVR